MILSIYFSWNFVHTFLLETRPASWHPIALHLAPLPTYHYPTSTLPTNCQPIIKQLSTNVNQLSTNCQPFINQIINQNLTTYNGQNFRSLRSCFIHNPFILLETFSFLLRTLGRETDLAELVSNEISAMDIAIEEAAKKIEELLEASRRNDSGVKLEVNEAVLDSCTELVKAIRELVNRSKALQREIMSERGGDTGSDREFYKMNSRWTEGLISASKAVGLGAKILVDAADR